MNRDIVVAGASAGGVEAITEMVEGLPADWPASLFVVVHFPPTAFSSLPQILERHSELTSTHASDGEPIRPGRIYVAPPDKHLLVCKGHVRLWSGPRENATRPAVDPLFRSAAQAYGPRTIGVVLSGLLDDGSAGLAAIKSCGGTAVVQDPADARHPDMPSNALQSVSADFVVLAREMAELLNRLVRQKARVKMHTAEGVSPARGEQMLEWEQESLSAMGGPDDPPPGRPDAPLTCPECGGAMWEVEGGSLAHFRCYLGHSFGSETLGALQEDGIECALWTAVRALEENSQLASRMAERAERRGNLLLASRLKQRAVHAGTRARLVRGVLVRPNALSRSHGEEPENPCRAE